MKLLAILEFFNGDELLQGAKNSVSAGNQMFTDHSRIHLPGCGTG